MTIDRQGEAACRIAPLRRRRGQGHHHRDGGAEGAEEEESRRDDEGFETEAARAGEALTDAAGKNGKAHVRVTLGDVVGQVLAVVRGGGGVFETPTRGPVGVENPGDENVGGGRAWRGSRQS